MTDPGPVIEQLTVIVDIMIGAIAISIELDSPGPVVFAFLVLPVPGEVYVVDAFLVLGDGVVFGEDLPA